MEGDRKCGEQSCDDGRRLKSVHRRGGAFAYLGSRSTGTQP